MFVIKRNNKKQEFKFENIQKRISYLIKEPYKLNTINSSIIAQKVVSNLYDGIHTNEIDNYTANLAASLSINTPEYGVLAGRIVINNCHKNTLNSFKDKMYLLYSNKDKNNISSPIIKDTFYKFVEKNQTFIENTINYDRDYLIDFFGYKTLETSYLIKIKSDIVERPQDLFMRVAIAIHIDVSDYKSEYVLDKVRETYDLMSEKYFTHATPTLFNAGTVNQSLASCFLLGSSDSLTGIMDTASDIANISKFAGGVGIHVSNWRSSGSRIRSTNGTSSGIVPFLKIYNNISRAFNQGGKRLGSFAIYLEPHHPDVMEFLSLRKTSGDENMRARDLYIGMWVSDLFMERVNDDSIWSMFDSDECPGLNDVYGTEYNELYKKYENDNKARCSIRARELWNAIFTSQKESGMPYMLYKDSVNKNNNQNNFGTIKSSNLCTEITIYSDENEYGVCHLASICLGKYVNDSYTNDELKTPEENRRLLNHDYPQNPIFDFKKLTQVVGVITNNLDLTIDKNKYPCAKAEYSSKKGRPIGIGVQGLADVFYKFKTPFDSTKARELNKHIFETIYYSALSKSSELAKLKHKATKDTNPDKMSGSYPHYKENGGSRLYNGKFHWELYGLEKKDLSGRYDWDTLSDHIKIYGVRHSLLVACMPTASTANIMGSSVEGTEAITSNLYTRSVLAGDFIIVNKYLLKYLIEINIWNKDTENYLKLNKGSIQGINGIPDDIKKIFRTVWEIPQRSIIDMAKDRQAFIDQSQSMNLFVEDYSYDKFSAMQFHAWRSGLKTGNYYVRTRAAKAAQTFTIDPDNEKLLKNYTIIPNSEIVKEEEICLLCSS